MVGWFPGRMDFLFLWGASKQSREIHSLTQSQGRIRQWNGWIVTTGMCWARGPIRCIKGLGKDSDCSRTGTTLGDTGLSSNTAAHRCSSVL